MEILLALALLAGLAISVEIGFRVGRRAAQSNTALASGQIGAIQGATLGLLALLLGFSFAGSAERFIERQDLIVTEANAIGTAYLRADLLDEPYRTQLRDQLARYVHHRLDVFANRHRLSTAEFAAAMARVTQFHEQIWTAARDGVLARPAAMLLVLPPVNDLLDLHTTRLSAARKQLPLPVLGLLMMCAALSMGVIGYGSGVTGGRHILMAGALALLVAASLWTTVDLDHSREGLIRLSDVPLEELNLPVPP